MSLGTEWAVDGLLAAKHMMTQEKLRVLIVDDDDTNILLLKGALESDYSVQIAKNGSNALEFATRSLPDLILLDIIIPEMNGYDVCKALKSKPDTCDIPIIFITSKDDDENEAKGLRLGAADYMTKPFNLAVVKARVKTHLDLKVYRDQLELRVADRTEALSASNKELEKKSKALDKTNIALNVLLDKKDDALEDCKEQVLRDVQNLVLPYLTKMKQESLGASKSTYIDIIQSNLNKLIESSSVNFDSIGFKMTPTEIQIANWIKEGKTTKQIAKMTNLVGKTIEWHRCNIREKLGVKNQKVSLRTHLMSM